MHTKLRTELYYLTVFKLGNIFNCINISHELVDFEGDDLISDLLRIKSLIVLIVCLEVLLVYFPHIETHDT